MSKHTFAVNDLVVWRSDLRDDFFLDTLREKHGNGPFIIKKVEYISEHQLSCGHFPGDESHDFCNMDEYSPSQTMRDAVGHHQMLTLHETESKTGDRTFSGYWFEPYSDEEDDWWDDSPMKPPQNPEIRGKSELRKLWESMI